MSWIKNVFRYLPLAWLGIKTIWQMYKSKLRQEGLRDALQKERERRIKAERDGDLRDRLDDSLDERRARILREAEAARED